MSIGEAIATMTRTKLTPRELQCLTHLASGLSNEGIARVVGIKAPTVAMHLANARLKLGAISREHAIAIAITNGLITIR